MNQEKGGEKNAWLRDLRSNVILQTASALRCKTKTPDHGIPFGAKELHEMSVSGLSPSTWVSVGAHQAQSSKIVLVGARVRRARPPLFMVEVSIISDALFRTV